MTEINPLAGAILASTHTQRLLAVDNGKQSRRPPFAHRDASGNAEQLEHEIESPDIVTLIGDDAPEHGEPQRHLAHGAQDEEEATPSEEEGMPHLDITG